MKKAMSMIIFLAASLGLCFAQTQSISREAGFFTASAYGQWNVPVSTGNAATGSASIVLQWGSVILPDGREIVPFSTSAPIIVDIGAAQETVTPTAVSGCIKGRSAVAFQTCTITASFSNLHGQGALVQSGSFGLVEAITDANGLGGGTVVVDQSWFALGGTKTTITNVTAATPKVWVLDNSTGSPVWYGKSGTGSAAYSNSNNDMVFSVTLSGGAGSKTLSQTYAVAPSCQATDTTAAAATKAAPTTSTVVLGGTTTDVLNVHCDILK